jgi:hypothetical protein
MLSVISHAIALPAFIFSCRQIARLPAVSTFPSSSHLARDDFELYPANLQRRTYLASCLHPAELRTTNSWLLPRRQATTHVHIATTSRGGETCDLPCVNTDEMEKYGQYRDKGTHRNEHDLYRNTDVDGTHQALASRHSFPSPQTKATRCYCHGIL